MYINECVCLCVHMYKYTYVYQVFVCACISTISILLVVFRTTERGVIKRPGCHIFLVCCFDVFVTSSRSRVQATRSKLDAMLGKCFQEIAMYVYVHIISYNHVCMYICIYMWQMHLYNVYMTCILCRVYCDCMCSQPAIQDIPCKRSWIRLRPFSIFNYPLVMTNSLLWHRWT